MIIEFKGKKYYFRKCDTGKLSKTVLKSLADNTGKVMFDQFNGNYYLNIPNVGYGIEENECILCG